METSPQIIFQDVVGPNKSRVVLKYGDRICVEIVSKNRASDAMGVEIWEVPTEPQTVNILSAALINLLKKS